MNTQKFLGWLTCIVVVIYVGASAIAFWKANIAWADFSGAVGPIVGMLVGYFVRGEK